MVIVYHQGGRRDCTLNIDFLDNQKSDYLLHEHIRGQRTSAIYPDCAVEKWEYDLAGNCVRKKNPLGVVTEYVHDPLGRVLEEKTLSSSGDNVLSCTSYEYQGLHLHCMTDPAGFRTIYEVDGAGRQSQETKEGRTTRYVYDALGRLHQTIREYEAGCAD